MFLQYYGLRNQPFGVTPDPRYFYPSAAHREALACLTYSFESNLGFASLVADPGLGKTTVLHCLLEQCGPATRTAFIFETQCDSRELLRHLLCDLEADPVDTDMNAMFRAFRDLVAEETQAGRRVLLIVDEAQNLSASALETIRLLSNFETPSAKLVHIVLSGQPQLAQVLARPELAQFRQRVTSLARLRPLSEGETGEYIDHRLRTGGHVGPPIFTSEAIGVIAQLSGGIPREINRICFNALSLGFAIEHRSIDASLIEETAVDLERVLAGNIGTFAPAPVLESPSARLASERTLPSDMCPASPPPIVNPTPRTIETVTQRRLAMADASSRQSCATYPAVHTQASVPLRCEYVPSSDSMRRGGTAGIARPSTTRAPELHAIADARPAANARLQPEFGAPAERRTRNRRLIGAAVLVLIIAAAVGLLAFRWRFVIKEAALILRAAASQRQRVSSRQATMLAPASPTPTEALGASRAWEVLPSERSDTRNLDRRLPVVRSHSRTLQKTTSVRILKPDSPQAIDVVQPPAIKNLTGVAPPALPEPAANLPLGRFAVADAHAGSSMRQSISPLRLIKRVLPHYPEDASAAGIRGSVVLSAHINKDGRVTDLRAVSGNAVLVRAAMDAVRQWVYSPYLRNGEPIEVDTLLRVDFSLD